MRSGSTSRALLRGAGGRAPAHRQHPARRAHGERRGHRGSSPSGGSSPRSSAATAWASTPPSSRRGPSPSRTPSASCGAGASSCRRPCPSARGRWPRSWAWSCRSSRRSAARRRRARCVDVANINSPGQIVIAGHRSAVERAVALAAARGGKRASCCPVSAPFHCRLMEPAAERLAAVLAGVRGGGPRVPVVRNVDAGLTTRADDVRPFLVRQVASPVRWTDCVERMAREGAARSSRSGRGRVLTGLLEARSTARSRASRSRTWPASTRRWRRSVPGRERLGHLRSSPSTGRVALVTGGTRGIGLAIAAALAEDGAAVVVLGRDAARSRRSPRELEGRAGQGASAWWPTMGRARGRATARERPTGAVRPASTCSSTTPASRGTGSWSG